jgi:preprotein translocase subunit YajC
MGDNDMVFKRGDKVRTDEGQMGEILFVDNDGVVAQVALERSTVRLRTDTLRVFDEKDDAAADLNTAPVSFKAKRAVQRPKK